MPDVKLYHLNIGRQEKIRYLPKTDDKKQALYADLVANPKVFNNETKTWEDGAPQWYNGVKFEGRDADLMRDDYQQGDSLIVFAEAVIEDFTRNDGTPGQKTQLYVRAFGPDPRRMGLSIDRSKRQDRSQAHEKPEPAQQAEQTVDDADPEAEPTQEAEAARLVPDVAFVKSNREVIEKRLSDSASRVQWSTSQLRELEAAGKDTGAAQREIADLVKASDEYAQSFGFANTEMLSTYLTEQKVPGMPTADLMQRAEGSLEFAEKEMRLRLNYVRSAGEITTDTGKAVLNALAAAPADADAAAASVDAVLHEAGASDQVRVYLKSVAENYAHGGSLKSWDEAADAAHPASATSLQQHFQNVDTIRASMAASASAPAM